MSDVLSNISIALQGKLDAFQVDVQFTVPAHGVTTLFGSSGSGKSSVLRAISGLETRLAGEIKVGQEIWQNERLHLPTHQRSVGLVFQEPSLFSHLDVRGNLEFGWKRTPVSERRVDRDEVIEKLGLAPLLSRRVGLLSGGEKQRVALGRAVLASPRLLLLDEPLSSLDGPSRREILPYLQALPSILKGPILYVSHSVAEVKWISDQVVFLERGKVQRCGTLLEVLPALQALDWNLEQTLVNS